ncbi:EF-hand domain-containing protein [Plasmodiophora brassicae]|uniref:EF-hand domain-containing protein n=1 Tax=Plasmodiophora brassicae TaxID=37360 RepID=A0A0G4IZ07_PLABS|nr:hypothetical protein PBRA_001398 [Plasmodiophora brassicae]
MEPAPEHAQRPTDHDADHESAVHSDGAVSSFSLWTNQERRALHHMHKASLSRRPSMLSRAGSGRQLSQGDDDATTSLTKHASILFSMAEEERHVKTRFTGRRRSSRDATRSVDEVLYADAGEIRRRLDERRARFDADLQKQSTRSAFGTPSKTLVLRKVRRDIARTFLSHDRQRTGRIDKDTLQNVLVALGIVPRAAYAPGAGHTESRHRRTHAAVDKFWGILRLESTNPGMRVDDKVAFVPLYRYLVLIMFPALLSIMEQRASSTSAEAPPPHPVVAQLVSLASQVPPNVLRDSGPVSPVFDRPLNPYFFPVGHELVHSATTTRLTQAIVRRDATASEGGNDADDDDDDDDGEFHYRPTVLPYSARLARRRRESGRRRFTVQLQEEARAIRARRDAERLRVHETALRDCTFRPETAPPGRPRVVLHMQRDTRTRFDQLYRQGVRLVRNRRDPANNTAGDVAGSDEREPGHAAFHMKPIPADVVEERPLPRGYDDAVERTQRAYRQRLRQQDELGGLGQQFVERYDHRERVARRRAERGLPARSPRAIQAEDEQFRRRLIPSRTRADPLLYVDVGVGSHRTGRIAIYPDSKPTVLAGNFAKVFCLDRQSTQRLTRLLSDHCRRVQAPAARDADDDIIEPSPDA